MLALVGFALGLIVASWIVPDFNVGGAGRALWAAVLIFVIGAILRPVLVAIAGWGPTVVDVMTARVCRHPRAGANHLRTETPLPTGEGLESVAGITQTALPRTARAA